MYNIDQLNAKNRDELRAIAKEMEIVGRGKMNKAELVQAIYDNQPFEEAEQPEVQVVEEVKDEVVVVPANDEKVDSKKNTKDDFSKLREENHRKIVEACEVGDFVAFGVVYDKDGNCTKARSAKVVRKSTKRQKLEVETAYGRKLIIGFDIVLWVKKTIDAKWPHGIYKLLKGIE